MLTRGNNTIQSKPSRNVIIQISVEMLVLTNNDWTFLQIWTILMVTRLGNKIQYCTENETTSHIYQ